MFSRPIELQLHHDPSARTLPWIIALMVFLACLALGGVLSLGTALERWDRGLSGTVTVQLLPPGPDDSFPGTFGDRLARTLEILRNTPGVLRAEALTDAEIAELLEPWLGSGEILQELPLPKLIDVTLDGTQRTNLAELEARLTAEIPGASLDDHKLWLEQLITFTRSVKLPGLPFIGTRSPFFTPSAHAIVTSLASFRPTPCGLVSMEESWGPRWRLSCLLPSAC
ncbi:MAG: cell division protein FtsX [Alphaproteobacteria bacterium]